VAVLLFHLLTIVVTPVLSSSLKHGTASSNAQLVLRVWSTEYQSSNQPIDIHLH